MCFLHPSGKHHKAIIELLAPAPPGAFAAGGADPAAWGAQVADALRESVRVAFREVGAPRVHGFDLVSCSDAPEPPPRSPSVLDPPKAAAAMYAAAAKAASERRSGKGGSAVAPPPLALVLQSRNESLPDLTPLSDMALWDEGGAGPDDARAAMARRITELRAEVKEAAAALEAANIAKLHLAVRARGGGGGGGGGRRAGAGGPQTMEEASSHMVSCMKKQMDCADKRDLYSELTDPREMTSVLASARPGSAAWSEPSARQCVLVIYIICTYLVYIQVVCGMIRGVADR